MDNLYLVPVETTNGGARRGPKYFSWRFDPDPPGIVCTRLSLMDYGFLPSFLAYARGISEADHTALIAHADVYFWPANLQQSISPQDTIKTFLEGINIPTNWTTAATTYLELLRSLAGMFQFLQRYGALSGINDPLFDATVTLDTRYRNLSAQRQAWFAQTVESFGYPSSIINQNSQIRQMLKFAADAWGAQPFYLGGMEF